MENQRIIKFRAWTDIGEMINPYCDLREYNRFFGEDLTNGPFSHCNILAVMQFTGQMDADNKEVWEGDIGRITDEQDFGDNNIYLICVWIKEWSMFGWIEHNELTAYESKGVDALDEFMFWTYNLEDAGVTVCGNIYQHPDYILKAQQEEERTMNNTLNEETTYGE